MKRKLQFLKTLLVAVGLSVGASDAWAVDVPTPVYYQNFESASTTVGSAGSNFGITGATLTGDGAIQTGDPLFGQYYQNIANATDETTGSCGSNYLTIATDAFSTLKSANATSMTVSFWVNPYFANTKTNMKISAGSMMWGDMFCARGDGTVVNTDLAFLETRISCDTYCNANYAPSSFYYDSNDGTYRSSAWLTDGSSFANSWHHVAIVYCLEGTNNVIKHYRDGVLVRTDTKANGGSTGTSMTHMDILDLFTKFEIGGNSKLFGDSDNALAYDEIAIYGSELSAEQIEKIIDTKLGYTTVTYDVDALSAVGNLTLSASRSAREKNWDLFVPTNCDAFCGKIVFQNNDTWNIDTDGLGQSNVSSGRHFALLDMNEGDKLAITYKDADGSAAATFKTRNVGAFASLADYSAITSGTEYTVSSGIAMFEIRYGVRISEIKFKTTATETMTAPTISSVANGAARTVTITAGASSIKSGATTYYTTDGTDPTSASTVYSAPFDVDATCTVKAISISNSSAETASTVTSQLINLDQVDTPTATLTAVDGINRTITFACATDGATLYYSTDNGDTYTAGTSLVISANTAIIVKAVKNASEAVSEVCNFNAGTTIDLLAPTVTHSAANQYTISNDQSSLLLSPTATVHYQIDGGAEQTSTETSIVIPISENGTLTYWLTATGYGSTASTDLDMYTTVPLATVTTIDLCTSNSNAWASRGVAIDGLADYYKYVSAENATSPVVSDGVFAATFSNGTDGNSTWRMQQTYAGTKNQNSAEKIAILGLKKDQVVRVMCDIAPTVNANATVFEPNTYSGNYSFKVSADGNVLLDIAKNTVIKKVYVEQSTVSATIPSSTYGTIASAYALDCANLPGGVTAYKVSSLSASSVTLEQVTEAVAPGTGLILSGTAGTYCIPVVASGTDISATNKLKAAVTAYDCTANEVYILKGGEFHLVNAASTVPAGKAYLLASDFPGGAPSLNFVFGGETTGINSVETHEAQNGAFYNLNGQRVAAPGKGLYIVNGKKVIIK